MILGPFSLITRAFGILLGPFGITTRAFGLILGPFNLTTTFLTDEEGAFNDIKKYFSFTAEETTEDVGWSHRGFSNDTNLNAFGSVNHPSEAYLYGMRILGLGFSKASQINGSSSEAYLLLGDNTQANSTVRHILPSKTFVKTVRIFEDTEGLTIERIRAGAELPIVAIDFSAAVDGSAYRYIRNDGNNDIVYMVPDAVNNPASVLIDGNSYFVEVNLAQQILQAEYGVASDLQAFSGPLLSARFASDELRTIPGIGTVFLENGNDLEISISYMDRPINLSLFERFVLVAGTTTVDSETDPEAIYATAELGKLRLNLDYKFTKTGLFESKLIAYNEQMPLGVILWDKSLENSKLVLNALKI